MANLALLRAEWSGFAGAPGVSTFPVWYENESSIGAAYAALAAAFVDWAGVLPDDTTISFPSTIDVYDSGTGLLVDELNVTPPAGTNGTALSQYAAACGMSVQWKTAGIVGGKRVRGRTFLVPVAAMYYEPDGGVSSAAVNIANSGAADIVTHTTGAADGRFVVWSRPRGTEHPSGPRVGEYSFITSASVSEKVAVLRSRRD